MYLRLSPLLAPVFNRGKTAPGGGCSSRSPPFLSSLDLCLVYLSIKTLCPDLTRGRQSKPIFPSSCFACFLTFARPLDDKPSRHAVLRLASRAPFFLSLNLTLRSLPNCTATTCIRLDCGQCPRDALHPTTKLDPPSVTASPALSRRGSVKSRLAISGSSTQRHHGL